MVFIGTFSFIWMTSFQDDYLKAVPKDNTQRLEIERANVWRGIISVIVFVLAF